MIDSLMNILKTLWFDYILEITEILYSRYLLETTGVIFAILLLLIIVLMLKKIRKRRYKPAKEDIAGGGEEFVSDDMGIGEKGTRRREVPGEPPVSKPPGIMGRLKSGLGKTRQSLTGRIESILSEKSITDSDALEEIEEVLITSDVGVETTMALMKKIEQNASTFSGPDDLKTFLKSEMLKFLIHPRKMDLSTKPYVIMVVGVNGVGKTTTIGKLAHKYQMEGKKVLIGAADTFRAAAVEQLEIWAERSGSDIVRHRENADPAAVAYDAIEAGISRQSDIVIIDTAGRLQTRVNLMEQLKKIKRSITKRAPDAPHEVLLVLDATTGQNAISQAKAFHEGIGVTSLAMTKLDGTAKGGIVIGICNTMKLPLQYIGVGEQIDDLQPFDPEKFIDAIF